MKLLTLLFFLLSISIGYVMSGDADADILSDFYQKILFYLYTRSNSDYPQELRTNDTAALLSSSYDVNRATKFVTHGWQENYTADSCTLVERAFLQQGDYNVVVVDWSIFSQGIYFISAAQLKRCAWYVAQMVDFLIDQGTDPDTMSIVGHSMGGHIAGLAGYQARTKVGHVVGLDAGRPGFENLGPGDRISSQDAKLVELIHTDAGDYGLWQPFGHLNFYPNMGGPIQYGCENDRTPRECSHLRSAHFYSEAIVKPDSLLGRKCLDYASFQNGYCNNNSVVPFPNSSTKDKLHGVYYLRTAPDSPFGLGMEGTRPANGS